MRTKKDTLQIISLLKEEYPVAECSLTFESPFQLLAATRLSAHCTDVRVNMVTPELFEKFPTPQALASANVHEVEDIIRSCGLYKTKAKDLVAMANQLMERFGGEIPNTMEELTALSGVGRKTANLILGEVFGIPAVIADTHCIRLANRIGFCKDVNPVKVESALREAIPPEESTDFCHRLVQHGRKVCDARVPRCDDCVLGSCCKKVGVKSKK